MYEKYGFGGSKSDMNSAALNFTEPLDSARGIIGKDNVAYSK